MTTYLEQSLESLKRFEGSVAWMYRDTVGKVTVGVGLMLVDADSATRLPFLMEGAPASPAQIVTEFDRITALPAGRLPAFYRGPTSPSLSADAIDAHLRATLTSFETELRTHLPDYDRLPDGAKLALLDMAYNLGPAGLLRGYPRLLQDIASGAWPAAAAQCLRHGISAERNAWTRLQLLSAAAAGAVIPAIQAAAQELRTLLRWAIPVAVLGLAAWCVLRFRPTLRRRPATSSPV